MNTQLYICDLPPDCTEEQLTTLLQPRSQVTAVEWQPSRDGSELRRAIVSIESDLPVLSIVGQLNGKSLGEQPIVATPAAPPAESGTLSGRQQSVSAHIATQLGEKYKWPRVMIQQTVGLCGVRFAQEMARRAQAIDEAGGMMLPDGSRRRTVGGIFFALTRRYVTPEIGRAIFHRTRTTVQELKSRARKAPPSTAPESPAPDANSAPESEPAPPEPPPAPSPEPEPEPPQPAPDPKALNAARERLIALREEMDAAQSALEAMKQGQATKSTGVFSLMKQVVDAQRAIDALLAEHPELG